MSAYLCNPEHIGVLANAMYRANIGLYCQSNSPQKMAAALAKANWISIEARYPGDNFMLGDQGFEEYCQACQHEACRPDPDLKPVDFIKIAQCFAYQACEAKEFQEAYYDDDYIGDFHINQFIMAMVRKMPGYDDAPWGYERKPDAPEVMDLSAIMMGS
jgi:hypothetical protein